MKLKFTNWTDGSYAFSRPNDWAPIGIVKRIKPGKWVATNIYCKCEFYGRTRLEAAYKLNAHMR